MRDILLTLIVAALLPMALWRPAIGAYLWAWISIMNPHMLTFGFARTVPFALLVAVTTALGFIFTKDRKALPINGGTVMLLLLMVWMTVTSVFALGDPALVWERWSVAMKIFFMLFLTLMLLRGRKQIDILVWVIVVSLGLYGVKGGLWTLVTGGAGRVWGPPGGMIAGNNELAVALVLLMPWMHYLRQTASRRWIRHALLLSMALVAFAILGTQSRGALLALLAMAFFLSLKGRHPIRMAVGMLILVSMAVAFMPDTWTQRMDTVQSYQDDGSAMSRLHTWKTLWNAAVDRPLVGAGFAADDPLVFSLYAPRDAQEALAGRVYVAHSIYFQALGEHGFPGLLLYLGIGAWTWRAAGRLARTTLNDPDFEAWVPLLMRMCQVSLAGFAAGGAFLSLMLLDLPYYILGIVVLTRATVHERVGSRTAAASFIQATANQGASDHALTGRSSA